ncbi:ParB/RepB/Spo0J family partition protein [Candidatus Bathyarchaeota archaeon]|nr:ParB/RepB/Spo0J family partition protein [Candidatus Bathyarchaeota archaeon]
MAIGTIKEIELDKIRPSRLNPRLEVNIERLNELAESIKEVGLLEPIIVRPVDSEFEVVVGERRYRASQQAGLKRIPAIVREYSDDVVVQLNLIENIQREDLNAVEKGKVCKYLLDECPEKYPSRTAIAEKIGVSTDAVSLWLKTVEVIPEEVQKLVAPSTVSGDIPEGKIDYLTAVKASRVIKEPERQVEVIKKLAEKRLPMKERAQVIEKAALEPKRPLEEVIEEVVETPSDLQFLSDDKQKILQGKKTQTSRTTIPDPKMKIGATVHAVIQEPRFADLRIVSIERKRLRYFNEDDAKNEGYDMLEEFKQKWQEVYEEWDESQLVYIIHFEKLK